MRRLILSMMVSVDGYTEAKNPENYWHNWNDEMTTYMTDFMCSVDTFIYGRRSYEDMIAYWPALDDPFAKIMNETPKLVFSRTPRPATWNSEILTCDPVQEIQQRKQQPGKNMVLFAGADLAQTCMNSNLIDEYRLIVNPLILNGTKPLFGNIETPMPLNLKNTITFNCGNVLLIYEPNPTR